MKKKLKINLDAGESIAFINDGTESKLYDYVDQVSIACGGHYGDSVSMRACVKMAKAKSVKIGAHPSYPDKENFGRKVLNISIDKLLSSLREQIENLIVICKEEDTELLYLKPHGALYNQIHKDSILAGQFIDFVSKYYAHLPLMCMASSELNTLCAKNGVATIQEAFVDRYYQSRSRLASRAAPKALVESLDDFNGRIENLIRKFRIHTLDEGWVHIDVESLCVHSDHPMAFEFLKSAKNLIQNSV